MSLSVSGRDGTIASPLLASSSENAVYFTEEYYRSYLETALSAALGAPGSALRISAPRYAQSYALRVGFSTPEDAVSVAYNFPDVLSGAVDAMVSSGCPSVDHESLAVSVAAPQSIPQDAPQSVDTTLAFAAAPGTEVEFQRACVASLAGFDGASPQPRGLQTLNAALASVGVVNATSLSLLPASPLTGDAAVRYDVSVQEYGGLSAADIAQAMSADGFFSGQVTVGLLANVPDAQARRFCAAWPVSSEFLSAALRCCVQCRWPSCHG